MKAKNIGKIFEVLSKENPMPKIELKYKNEFTLFTAVVLSAQSTDKKVNEITSKLFEIADNPYKMLILGQEELTNRIKSIGLYNSKAKNIIAACHIMISQYNGQLPNTFEGLIKLPGVGRKSANVLLNSLFDKNTIGVDTHVFRVSNRLGICFSKTPEHTESILIQCIPDKWKKYAHNWLVLHGRYICKAKKPLCNKCKIRELCEFEQKQIILPK